MPQQGKPDLDDLPAAAGGPDEETIENILARFDDDTPGPAEPNGMDPAVDNAAAQALDNLFGGDDGGWQGHPLAALFEGGAAAGPQDPPGPPDLPEMPDVPAVPDLPGQAAGGRPEHPTAPAEEALELAGVSPPGWDHDGFPFG